VDNLRECVQRVHNSISQYYEQSAPFADALNASVKSQSEKKGERERDSHACGFSKERVRAPLSVQASRKGMSRRRRRGREEAVPAEETEETIIMLALLYKTMIQLHDALSCESIVRGTT